MLRVALRGAFSRKLRLALTALSVALGVALVAGSYVLTDTMMYAFTSLFTKTGAKVDVFVQAPSHYTSQQPVGHETDRAPVPEVLVDEVRAAPGVLAVSGQVSGYAQIVGKNGKAITTSGAPTLGVSADSDSRLSSVTMRQGREPVAAGEVAIDAHTATSAGFKVGDPVTILFQGPTQTFTLVGTFGFDEVDSMAGATVAAFDLPTAQGVLGKAGVFDDIAVKAVPGWTQDQLRTSVAGTLGGSWEVITGQTQSDRTLDTVKSSMGFISTAMLVFAGIALFVGAFIIFNTFSILVAQRTREFGLLRALGAGTGQVVAAVVIEALAVGVIASLIGLGLGAGIAVGLTKLMSAIGLDLPPAPLQYLPRTIVVSLAVGIGVTLAASVGPALRTRRLSPMRALQSGLTGDRTGSIRRRLELGVPAMGAGLGLLAAGMTGRTGHGVVFFMAGAVAVFLGVASLSSFAIRPLASFVGWPLVKLFRLPARLGLRNAVRSPSRTARTAAALMIGLGLISFVTILGASMKASTASAIDTYITADYLLTPASAQNGGFSTEVAQVVRSVPGVAGVAEMRFGFFERNGVLEGVGGADAASLEKVTKITMVGGDLASIDQGGVAIGKKVADGDGLKVGDTIVMVFDHTGAQTVPIVAIYDDAQGSIGEYLLGMSTFSANYSIQLDSLVAVSLRSGADLTATGAAISTALAAYPNVKVQDHAAFRQDALAQVDQLLAMMYTLLALAVVIALLGIVNTLALSTMERVRELGLLRAIGMTRREVRAMVRHEAVIVAFIGGVLGMAVGVLFAAVALTGMRDMGLGQTAYPIGQLAIFLVLAALAGILAAVLPARRAARVDVLRAISTM